MEKHETNNLDKIKEKKYEDFQRAFELISQNIDYGIAIQNIEKWDKVEYINNKALEYLGCTLKEFKEIFAEEINQLAPKREIEFSIDLIPRTGAVALAPYRMSPLELIKLKK